MNLKRTIEENSEFSFYEEISFGSEIIVEKRTILPVYRVKILFFNEYVPNATVTPLAFLFKEEIKKDNESKYEYYLIFFDEDYEKYTEKIIKKYNEKFEQEIEL